MNRIMAIDFGTKRIGLAITDPDRIIATALATITASRIFDFLKDYFSKEAVDLVIIGYPDTSDGNQGAIQKKILNFAAKLKQEFNKEVVLFDERYTSKLAFQTMIDAGIKKKKKKG